MQVRPARAPSGANLTERLALLDLVTKPHQQLLTVQERTVEPGAMIDDQEVALQGKGMIGGEHNQAIRRCHIGRAPAAGEIDAAVIAGGRTAIDALRTKTS